MAGQTVKVRSLDNKETGSLSLSEAVFGAAPNGPLVFEAVRAYMAAGRSGTHDTKTRGEVQGSGRKLWKQKKTGRARIGSIRSPLWRHGGTVHGPTPRSYAYAFPRRKRSGAIRVALSEKMRAGRLLVLESLDLASHRTKELAGVLDTLGVRGSALLLDEPIPRNLSLAARNIPHVTVGLASGAGIVDLLRHEWIVMSEAAARRLEEVLAS
jgi:large subunit ribosomal protein L4